MIFSFIILNAFLFLDASSTTTKSLKKPEVKADIVSKTIQKFHALSTVDLKSKYSPSPQPSMLRISTPPLPRKSRGMDSSPKRTFSISPRRFGQTILPTTSLKLKNISTTDSPRAVSPIRCKTNNDAIATSTNVDSTCKSINTTNLQKPKENVTNTNLSDVSKLTTKPPLRPKKIAIDTSASFRKAAAFWNKS